ncbi:MAG: hypothetical protein ACK56F_24380, partial [bacterium]
MHEGAAQPQTLAQLAARQHQFSTGADHPCPSQPTGWGGLQGLNRNGSANLPEGLAQILRPNRLFPAAHGARGINVGHAHQIG